MLMAIPMSKKIRYIYSALRWYPISMFLVWFPLTVILFINTTGKFPARKFVEPFTVLSTQSGTVLALLFLSSNKTIRMRWRRFLGLPIADKHHLNRSRGIATGGSGITSDGQGPTPGVKLMPGHRTGEVGGHSTGHDIKSSNGSGASNMSDFMYQDSEDLEITASGSSALGGSKPPSHGSGGGNDGGGPWSPKRPGSPASLSSNSLQGWAASNEDNEEYFRGENFTEGLG